MKTNNLAQNQVTPDLNESTLSETGGNSSELDEHSEVGFKIPTPWIGNRLPYIIMRSMSIKNEK